MPCLYRIPRLTPADCRLSTTVWPGCRAMWRGTGGRRRGAWLAGLCRYKVRTIDCLEAEFEGKKVVKSAEWEQNHNYKGVYDMILDSNR